MTRKVRRNTEEHSYSQEMLNKARRSLSWWRSGDIPPSYMISSIIFFAIIFLSGLMLLVVLVLSSFGISCTDIDVSRLKLALFAITMFTPGSYVTWISLCCWRKVSGYDWWMIPHFD